MLRDFSDTLAAPEVAVKSFKTGDSKGPEGDFQVLSIHGKSWYCATSASLRQNELVEKCIIDWSKGGFCLKLLHEPARSPEDSSWQLALG